MPGSLVSQNPTPGVPRKESGTILSLFLCSLTMSLCVSRCDRADKTMSHPIQVGSSFLEPSSKLHSHTQIQSSSCITRSTYLHNVLARSVFGHLYRMTSPCLPMKHPTNLYHPYQTRSPGVEPTNLLSHYLFQAVLWIYVTMRGHRETPYQSPTILLPVPTGSSQRCLFHAILHSNNLGSRFSLSVLTLSRPKAMSDLMPNQTVPILQS
jgi:hypothetical protein